jgi:hypothetical protein
MRYTSREERPPWQNTTRTGEEAWAKRSSCWGYWIVSSSTFSSRLHVPISSISEGTSVEDIRSVFARTTIDHVIMGGGLPLETRLEMVRVIFESSETTSVHMKDVASGSQGFLPFVRSVLSGLWGETE